jgi:uncharacterized protein
MDPLRVYSIPVPGLKVGVHRFEYMLDEEFFRHFDGAPIGESRLEAQVVLDKRSDMFLIDFVIEGTMKTECDRCTAPIDLPLHAHRDLVVKYGEADGDDEDEVVFIPRDAPDFNVARYLYEFTVLSLPISNTYDCQSEANPPCNFEILKYLKTESGEEKPDTIWDALKGLQPDDN